MNHPSDDGVGTPWGERNAWLNVVDPLELDNHMAGADQAGTNAAIVKEMFARFPSGPNATLLVHGCGTCQMFDFVDLRIFGGAWITFADFSPRMLEIARRRLSRFTDCRHEIVSDDIERTAITRKCDAVLLVLVLLHVDWKKALENMVHLGVRRLYIIEQVQQPGASTVTARGALLPSIQKFNEVASPDLIDQEEMAKFLNERGYRGSWRTEQRVPGDKSMVGCVFEK